MELATNLRGRLGLHVEHILRRHASERSGASRLQPVPARYQRIDGDAHHRELPPELGADSRLRCQCPCIAQWLAGTFVIGLGFSPLIVAT